MYINKNEANSNAIVFTITESMTLNEFKRIASEKVGLKRIAKRVYFGSGGEVSNLEEIPVNSNLFLSCGESFYRSTVTSVDNVAISILGAGDVGKSAIALRFIRDAFIQNWDATIEDVYRKTVRIDDHMYMLEILDTAGQEDFSTLRSQWMQNRDAYIFVYSCMDKESLSTIYDFIDLLPQVCINIPIPPIIIVGNKADLLDNKSNSDLDLELKYQANGAVGSEFDEDSLTLEVEKLVATCKRRVQRLQTKWVTRQQQRSSNRERRRKESTNSNNSSNSSPISSNSPDASGEPKNEVEIQTPIYVEHITCSALSGENIEYIFNSLVRSIEKSRANNNAIVNKHRNSTKKKPVKTSWCVLL